MTNFIFRLSSHWQKRINNLNEPHRSKDIKGRGLSIFRRNTFILWCSSWLTIGKKLKKTRTVWVRDIFKGRKQKGNIPTYKT